MQEPSGNRSPETRHIDWLGILRILIAQGLVLLALAVAFIRYVEWSSAQAWEELSGAVTSAPPAKTQPPRPATPVRSINAKATCARKA